MIPVTTRLELVARDGLVPTLKALLDAGIPGIVLEAPSADLPLPIDLRALEVLRPPVVGAIAPIHQAPSSLGTIASADPDVAEAAARAVRATAGTLAAVGGRNVVAVVGAAGLAGEEEIRVRLARPDADARREVGEWRARTRRERERRVARLCPVLHRLAGAVAPQRILVLPGLDPLGLLDPESAEWVLEDLKPHALGLALDSGWTWAGEARGGAPLRAWLEAHAARLGFLFVSDHDSSGCGEILPGAGRGDLALLRDVIGKRLPRAVRPDPRASRADLLGSVGLAARHLGAVGEVVGW